VLLSTARCYLSRKAAAIPRRHRRASNRRSSIYTPCSIAVEHLRDAALVGLTGDAGDLAVLTRTGLVTRVRGTKLTDPCVQQ